MTATTYIDDAVVVCVLENISTTHGELLVVGCPGGEVIDGRLALQTDEEDEFTAVVTRPAHRRVVAS